MSNITNPTILTAAKQGDLVGDQFIVRQGTIEKVWT